jgi:hypothetical protein
VAITNDGLLLSFDAAPPSARRSIEPTASILLEFIVMSTIRTLLASFLFASAALSASAQTQPAAGASAPMGGAMMSQDCAKPMAKHDHGADKGMPRPTAKAEPCMGDAGATAPAASASAPKKQPNHDHSKFHKTS